MNADRRVESKAVLRDTLMLDERQQNRKGIPTCQKTTHIRHRSHVKYEDRRVIDCHSFERTSQALKAEHNA